jgi:hypothetical protein
MESLAIKQYESRLRPMYERLEKHDDFRMLRSPTVDSTFLERFLIEYCSRGPLMTEPVEGWIRRAGERCIELGFEEVGRSLVMHAKHEAGHHLMMIEDARYLVTRWNERHSPRLDADALLNRPMTPATDAYIKLHEETIDGDMPYGQVAIEYQIEKLSIDPFTAILANCEARLGREILGGMSFLKEHVEIDVGHTALNEKILERLLTAHPDKAEAMARIGSQALEIYISFVEECCGEARREQGEARIAASAG